MTFVLEQERWRRREYYNELLDKAEMNIQENKIIYAKTSKYAKINRAKFRRHKLTQLTRKFTQEDSCLESNKEDRKNKSYLHLKNSFKHYYIINYNSMSGIEQRGVYARGHHQDKYSRTFDQNRGKLNRGIQERRKTVKEYDEDRRSWAKREEYRGRPDKKSGNSVRSGGYHRSNLSGRSEATHNEECTERTKK